MASAPLHLTDIRVEAQWIDYNGHMNVGYYGVAFDRATDVLIDELGMHAAYRASTHCTVYVLESHINYLSELKLAQQVAVDVHLLDFDAKRLHYFMRMLRHDDGECCACSEIMLMHVDAKRGRAAAMPEAVLDNVRRLAEQQRALARSEWIGSRIEIRRL